MADSLVELQRTLDNNPSPDAIRKAVSALRPNDTGMILKKLSAEYIQSLITDSLVSAPNMSQHPIYKIICALNKAMKLTEIPADVIVYISEFLDIRDIAKFSSSNKLLLNTYDNGNGFLAIKKRYSELSLAVWNGRYIGLVCKSWDSSMLMAQHDFVDSVFVTSVQKFIPPTGKAFQKFGNIRLCRVKLNNKNKSKIKGATRVKVSGFDPAVTDQINSLKGIAKSQKIIVLQIQCSVIVADTTMNKYGQDMMANILNNLHKKTKLKHLDLGLRPAFSSEPLFSGFDMEKIKNLSYLSLRGFVSNASILEQILSLPTIEFLDIETVLHQTFVDEAKFETDTENEVVLPKQIYLSPNVKFFRFAVKESYGPDTTENAVSLETAITAVYRSIDPSPNNQLQVVCLPTIESGVSENNELLVRFANATNYEQEMSICLDYFQYTLPTARLEKDNITLVSCSFEEEVIEMTSMKDNSFDYKWSLNP